jgi:hypothetical protein
VLVRYGEPQPGQEALVQCGVSSSNDSRLDFNLRRKRVAGIEVRCQTVCMKGSKRLPPNASLRLKRVLAS